MNLYGPALPRSFSCHNVERHAHIYEISHLQLRRVTGVNPTFAHMVRYDLATFEFFRDSPSVLDACGPAVRIISFDQYAGVCTGVVRIDLYFVVSLSESVMS